VNQQPKTWELLDDRGYPVAAPEPRKPKWVAKSRVRSYKIFTANPVRRRQRPAHSLSRSAPVGIRRSSEKASAESQLGLRDSSKGDTLDPSNRRGHLSGYARRFSIKVVVRSQRHCRVPRHRRRTRVPSRLSERAAGFERRFGNNVSVTGEWWRAARYCSTNDLVASSVRNSQG